jgi:hypothetical protein
VVAVACTVVALYLVVIQSSHFLSRYKSSLTKSLAKAEPSAREAIERPNQPDDATRDLATDAPAKDATTKEVPSSAEDRPNLPASRGAQQPSVDPRITKRTPRVQIDDSRALSNTSPAIVTEEPPLNESIPISEIVIRSGRLDPKSAQVWKTTTVKPHDDWYKPEFKAERWLSKAGGFGANKAYPWVSSTWDTKNIWMLCQFNCKAKVKTAYFDLFHDDDVVIYINGSEVLNQKFWVTEHRRFELTAAVRSTIQKGANTIAIHCYQSHGWQGIDVGLEVEYDRAQATNSRESSNVD